MAGAGRGTRDVSRSQHRDGGSPGPGTGGGRIPRPRHTGAAGFPVPGIGAAGFRVPGRWGQRCSAPRTGRDKPCAMPISSAPRGRRGPGREQEPGLSGRSLLRTAAGAGSRLGNPLVNEVLIPLGKKDLWNSLPPADDKQLVSRTPSSRRCCRRSIQGCSQARRARQIRPGPERVPLSRGSLQRLRPPLLTRLTRQGAGTGGALIPRGAPPATRTRPSAQRRACQPT